LHVGAPPEPGSTSAIANAGTNGKTGAVTPWLVVTADPPLTASTATGKTASPVPDEKVTDLDRQVFGPRRVYSMTLNMPNLNSSGGSWVIRFSELKEPTQKGDLIAPEATHKVDPGYPIELIRQNVQGTVTLRAVIHSDGRVSDVTVLNSPDERLDSFAQSAFEHWHFRPGMKNGNAVALEAVVSIPFRIRSSF
jgi:TonB family protein